MTKREQNEKRRFILFMVLAVVVGVAYLFWGQSNTATTIYDMAFNRYRASAQLSQVEVWQRTEAEQQQYDLEAAQAATWAGSTKSVAGSYVTKTAAKWFGTGAELTLDYTLYEKPQAVGTVILLHGFEGGAEEARLWAPFWWEQGYQVLIPLQRGYREPSETNYIPTTWGVYEQFDLYDLIAAAGLADEKLLIHGRGLGAAGALLLCANEELADAGVDGLVLESVYDTLGSVQRDLQKRLFELGDWFVGRFLRSRIQDRLGFQPDSVDLTAASANLKAPVLFIAGSEEGFLGEARTQAVWQSCAAPVRQYAALRGSYRALWLTDGEAYQANIRSFLDPDEA